MSANKIRINSGACSPLIRSPQTRKRSGDSGNVATCLLELYINVVSSRIPFLQQSDHYDFSAGSEGEGPLVT
jgi:hypothetical protein